MFTSSLLPPAQQHQKRCDELVQFKVEHCISTFKSRKEPLEPDPHPLGLGYIKNTFVFSKYHCAKSRLIRSDEAHPHQLPGVRWICPMGMRKFIREPGQLVFANLVSPSPALDDTSARKAKQNILTIMMLALDIGVRGCLHVTCPQDRIAEGTPVGTWMMGKGLHVARKLHDVCFI